MKSTAYCTDFIEPSSISNKNLQRIFQFYLLECPVEGKSWRGKSFKQLGYIGVCSFSKLKKQLLQSATPSLEKNYMPSKKEELPSNFKKCEDITYPDEYCAFLKSDEKAVISSLFSAIRNALAHGSFNVKSYKRTRIYYFYNCDKYEKAKIVLHENTLLSWIDIIKKESKS